ncbi:MAG TPA: hypothetical protein VH475_12580, partial [Tepidisphaeraceae bacterium]
QGVLPDGDYVFQIDAELVKDAKGNPLDGNGDGAGGDDFSFGFFHLSGDANHDRAVGFGDVVVLAQRYNGPAGATYDQGDFNYDGVVDFADLTILAQHYNTDLATIAAPVAATHASAPVAGIDRHPRPASVFHARRIVIAERPAA